jgi:cyclic pyranopterin phosphate synthase
LESGIIVNPPAGRIVDYLRLSVTDRCNFRCIYCMPPEGVPFKEHDELLTYEEMAFFVEVAAQMGISKVRVTGGEPLVRRGLPKLIGKIRRLPGIREVSLTTNGVLLPRFVRELKAEGLDRVNISLDSLDAERFRRLTRGGSLEAVLAGVDAALDNDLHPVKLNAVALPETLEELPAFVALTKDRPLHVRFIEWMPVGGCGPRSTDETVRQADIRDALKKLGDAGLGWLAPAPSPTGWGPARYYSFPDHQGTIGFIGSVSDHFCGECNRLRLTADGHLKHCLFSSDEVDACPAIRAHDRDEVTAAIQEALARKTFNKRLVLGSASRGMSQVGG